MEGKRKMSVKPLRIISNTSNLNGEKEAAMLLSPSSRMFHEPSYNVYVLAVMGWKVTINIDSIKAELQSKMLKHPRFSSLQVMDESGNMRWVPTRVNIDDHVIVPKFADNNNMDNDELVENYMSNLSTTNVDMSKPLWDFHILNVKTSHAEATCVFRIHHSIGDGAALMSFLLSCFRTTSDPTCLPKLPVFSSSNDKSNSSPNKNRKKNLWLYLVKLCLLLFNTMVDVLLFIATALFLKDSQTPFTTTQAFNASARQRYIYRSVSLDDIKFIKDVTNAKVNDVVLGIIQAALSRYFHRTHGKAGKFSVEGMRCRANVIVNLRPALGVQAIDEMIEKNVAVIQGNCFGFVLVPLSIGQLDNPLDYVAKAKTLMDRKKHSLGSQFSFYASQLFLNLFGFKGAAKLTQRVTSQTTLALSNVIGPREQISCAGHPLEFIAPTCSGYPTGIMVHVCSYVNKLTFTIAVDEGIIPDLNQFGDDFIKSFMLIKEAAHAHHTKLATKLD